MKETLMELVNEGTLLEPREFSAEKSREAINRIKSLGFVTAIKDSETRILIKEKEAKISQYSYLAFDAKKIQGFLNRKAEEYNKKIPKQKKKEEAASAHYFMSRNYGLQTVYYNMPTAADQWTVTTSNTLYDSSIPQQVALYQDMLQKSTSRRSSFQARTDHYSSSEPNTIGRYCWNEVPVEEYKGVPPENVLDTFADHRGRELFDFYTVAEVEGIRDPLLLGRLDGSELRYFIAQWDEDVNIDDII